MLHRESPQVRVTLFGPMKEHVHHHCTCPVHNRLDGSFCCAILMVGTDSTVRDRLVEQIEVVLELFRSKRVIICVKVFEYNIMSFCELLEFMFTFDGVT